MNIVSVGINLGKSTFHLVALGVYLLYIFFRR